MDVLELEDPGMSYMETVEQGSISIQRLGTAKRTAEPARVPRKKKGAGGVVADAN